MSPPQDVGDLALLGSAQPSGSGADSTYGMFMGGAENSGYTTEINRTTIGTSGEGEDFGDLTSARGWTMTVADATRGVCGGGGVYSAIIDYVTVAGGYGTIGGGSSSNQIIETVDHITIQTAGTVSDWGDMQQPRYTTTGTCTTGVLNNSQGMILSGVVTSFTSVASIQHLTIGTTGTASDFGDCSVIRRDASAVANNDRVVVGAGVN